MKYLKYGIGYLLMAPMFVGLLLTWLLCVPLILCKVGTGWGVHANDTYEALQDKLGL